MFVSAIVRDGAVDACIGSAWRTEWPKAVRSAATALLSATTPAEQVQVYANDIVDIWNGGGGNPDIRHDGDAPSAIATARDALKAAVEASL